MTTFVLKSGSNKGNRRIWIERDHLSNAGFNCGMRLSRTMNPDGTMTLSQGDNGGKPHKVAGTAERPIIDLNGKWVTEFMGDHSHFEVTVDYGSHLHFRPITPGNHQEDSPRTTKKDDLGTAPPGIDQPAKSPPLPDTIPLEVFLRAIQRIDENGYAPHGVNHSYEVIHEGKGYPPIAVVTFAMEELTGLQLPVRSYEGYRNSKTFSLLRKAGLAPVAKSEPGDEQDKLARKAHEYRNSSLEIDGSPQGNVSPTKYHHTVVAYKRDPQIVAAILKEASGYCELCRVEAPFTRRSTGTPYLEVHHVVPLAEGGEDTLRNSVALCPNCHAQCHYSIDHEEATNRLYDSLSRLHRPDSHAD